MNFLDDGPSMPLYLVAEGYGGVYGLFYNSWDKKRHLAFYVPQKTVPGQTLCKASPMNFSPTRDQDNLCPDCLKRLKELDNA